MPVITCPTSGPACTTCPDDFPVLNLSAELPDVADNFMGYFDGGDIPLGGGFSSKGCISTVFSSISQEDADLQAQLQSKICQGGNNGPPGDPCVKPGVCVNNPDDPGGGGIPTPIPRNAEQRISCDDDADLTNVSANLPSFLSIDGSDLVCAANSFTGLTQAEADNNALNYVTQFFIDNIDSGDLVCGNLWETTPQFGNFTACSQAPRYNSRGTTISIDVLSSDRSAGCEVVAGGGPCIGTHSDNSGASQTASFGPYTVPKTVVISGTVSYTPGSVVCAFNSGTARMAVQATGLTGYSGDYDTGLIFWPASPISSFFTVTGTLPIGNVLTVTVVQSMLFSIISNSAMHIHGTVSIT